MVLHMEQLGRAASTRRSAYAAMRSTFDDAVIDGLLAASPVLRVKCPRATQQEATSLTPEQVTQLLHCARDPCYERVLRLILGTACVAARRWRFAGRTSASIGTNSRSRGLLPGGGVDWWYQARRRNGLAEWSR